MKAKKREKMSFATCLKRIRERSFCTQEEMAQELNVAISTVNRWEKEKSRPSISTMKAIKAFCEKHNCAYGDIENEWLNYTISGDSK